MGETKVVPEQENMDMRYIVSSVSSLFTHFILVDLEKDTYRCLFVAEPNRIDFPESGRYEDFICCICSFLENKDDEWKVRKNLEKNAIIEGLGNSGSSLQYEYLVRYAQTPEWMHCDIICQERKNGKPCKVMFLWQNITTFKEKEKRTRNEVSMLSRRAQRANIAKNTFLTNMSHDIRTPMNAIIGYTNIALNYIDNREKVQSCLHKILTSSSHLLNLFNDILNMSHIENGEMQIKEQECSLPELIDDVLDILQPQVKAKHLELSVNTYDVVDEDIIADPLKLCQIFVNLLGNSVKYTLAGGRIIFDIYQKKAFGQDFGDYIFIVRDNGIGMYPEFIEHIYEPFERESTVTKSGIKGVGIGMTITKHIVDMMGGTIAVRSRKGEGSEFQVELRMRLQDGEKSAVQVEELTGLRVMVVDDSADRCDSVCSMLGLLGMRVERAFTPKEAIARAGSVYNEEDPFRVYIIDWQMAEKDGTEVIKKIREIIGKNVPIMILTSYDGGDTEKKWKIAGADVFCARPLFISGLKSALLSVIHPSEKEKVSPVKVDFKGRRVLLVDDNEMNREIAETVLTESGFLVETASDGTDAVVMVQRSEEHYYDAVLTDIQMPVMDGYEAARAIRTLDREDVHTLPIIAISANGMEEDKEMALVSGINDWIDKPLYVDAFIEVLTKYLAE